MIALVTALNIRGTRQSADVQGVATVVKVGALVTLSLLLIGRGLTGSETPQTSLTHLRPPTALNQPGLAVLSAMIGVLWAYEGWQYVTFSAGETADPQRTFGRGIVVGTAVLIVVYVTANVGYFSALGVDGVAASTRVASDAATAAFGAWAGQLIAAVILVSIFSAANGLTLTLPRLFYAMARDRVFFKRLADVHTVFGTPAAAILSTSAWSVVLVLSGSFEQLLAYVVFMSWLWFALAAAAIFVYRARTPNAPRPFRTPGYPVTPVLFIAAALVIVVNTVVAQPQQSIVGLAFALAGVPAYFVWLRQK
jgi:APA family basic amino acid/polyamine antiporter